MNIDKIKETARITMYYQGLNSRLREIVSDLAKIEAQDKAHNRTLKEKGIEGISEQETSEALYRAMYKAVLLKEADGIRLITETPVIKQAE